MSSQISSSVSAIAAKEGMILMLSYKTFLSWFDTSLSFSLERNGTAIGLSKGFLAFASALDTWEWSLLPGRKSVVASEGPEKTTGPARPLRCHNAFTRKSKKKKPV